MGQFCSHLPGWERRGSPYLSSRIGGGSIQPARLAEAAAAGQAVGQTSARHSTQGSTAAGSTAGITAGGAVTTAGTIKPPPHGRADKGLIIGSF